MKNRTNSIIGITAFIGIIVFTREIDFWPVKLSFFMHTGFIVFDSFVAFSMCVINYFAVVSFYKRPSVILLL
jgi:hypothetical protein